MRKQTLLALTRSINADLRDGDCNTYSFLALKNEEELVTIYDYAPKHQFHKDPQDGNLLHVICFPYSYFHADVKVEELRSILMDKRNDLQDEYDEVSAKGDQLTDEDLDWQYNCGKVLDALDRVLEQS